jgi:hypothetical protein
VFEFSLLKKNQQLPREVREPVDGEVQNLKRSEIPDCAGNGGELITA